MSNSVILFCTHFISDFVLNSYRRIKNEVRCGYDVVLLISTNDKEILNLPTDINAYICDIDSINSLEYNPICETLLPGSCHFPLLRFYLDYPLYHFYWFIEYDVYFSGCWSNLFEDCDTNLGCYDFIGSQISKYDIEKNGSWLWWTCKNESGFPLEKCVKGFNPICRYSRQALKCLDMHLSKGYCAHSEVMITTCLYNNQMLIGDFGGQGEFVPEGWENKYYIPKSVDADDGSIRYRPVFSMEEIKSYMRTNTLFHPLKE